MAIREKVWTCPRCGSKVKGRYKACTSCHAPRDKEAMASMTSQGKAGTVTDAALLKAARRGPDWFCGHCGAGNYGDGDRCEGDAEQRGCGAPRYGTAEENHPNFPDAHKRVEGADAKLEREMNRDPRADAVSAEQPPDPPKVVRRTPPPRPPPPPVDDTPASEFYNARSETPWLLYVLGAMVATLVGAFVVWAMQTHDVDGSVTAMSWTRTVHVEQWQNTTTRLWKHETAERAEVPPVNGRGEQAGLRLLPGTCRDEHYKTIQVVCGSHQECKDVYRTERESYSCTRTEKESYTCMKPGPRVECGEVCTDLGNGFEDCNPTYCPGPDVSDTCYRDRQVPDTCYRDKEVFDHKECWDVTDYCPKKLYESKCDYATQKWVAAGNHPSSGNGKDLAWKNVTLGPLERATYSASQVVQITFVDGRKSWNEQEKSEASRTSRASAEASANGYLSWSMGERVVVPVNNLGGVAGEPRRLSAR